MKRLARPAVIIPLIGCLFFLGGLHFWVQWEKKRFEESLPTPPITTQEVQSEQPNAEPVQSGHWHSDKSNAEPHAPVEPPSTAKVSQPPLQDSPSVITQENQTADSFTDSPSLDAKKLDEYQQRLRQYDSDYRRWRERYDKAYQVSRQLYEEGNKLSPSVTEIGVEAYIEYLKKIRSLPEAERNKLKAADEVHLEKLNAVYKDFKVLLQEEPVRPTPPKNN